MRTPEELRKRLDARWKNQRRNWLLGKGEWPYSLLTERPTGAKVLADGHVFEAWLLAWREVGANTHGRVEQETVNLGPAGEQQLPCRWVFDSPDAVAAELGQATRWSRAKGRFDTLVAWKAHAEAWRSELSRHLDLLADLDDAEFERLCRVVDWLWRRPASGLYPRQLPIPGIDSKWVESRRAVVAAWVRALQGGGSGSDFYVATGLRAAPDRLRMRLLDEALRKQLGGLSDIEAPVSEFVDLHLSAQRVLIVENLVTGLACETLPGTVVFMRRGYAVDALAKLLWLVKLPVFYWGDIDTHGLAILNRLRAYFPQTCSLMMDAETLQTFQPMWGREDKPHTADELQYLSKMELQLYRALREGEYKQVRLEQERIAWNWAWQRVLHSLSPEA